MRGGFLLLSAGTGLLIDPHELPMWRFLLGMGIFAFSIPFVMVETAALYQMSLGERLRPRGDPMLLWVIVSALARLTGPLWSVLIYEVFEDPLIFFSCSLIGSFLGFVLLVLLWNAISERQRLARSVRASQLDPAPNIQNNDVLKLVSTWPSRLLSTEK